MQARLLRQMMEGGFSLGLARAVVGRLPQSLSEAQGTAWLTTVLARNLRCVQAQDGFDAGGVFALVGPTGVGKTTTTAKIAARHLLRNGPGSVALITVDTYRLGAHDQLRAFGKILNVPVHVAHDAPALHDLLRLRQERQLVLVDTVGMSQRDDRIVDLLDMLPSSQVHRVMVVSAAAQPESIEESLQAFRSSQARGVVLTKLDEASRLGGALDCVIRARLPLMGLCDGQRVPEDWQAPEASRMIRRALQARVPEAFSLGAQSLATAMGVAASKTAEPVHA
jgi:flagellar biosynthesis protein FlhF